MSLYITGSQCIFAPMKNQNDDWEIFDDFTVEFEELAEKHNVKIKRSSCNEFDTAFVIGHSFEYFDSFYQGEIFEVDFFVPTSEDFEKNALAFIKELESNDLYYRFHNLNWNNPAVRYIVTS